MVIIFLSKVISIVVVITHRAMIHHHPPHWDYHHPLWLLPLLLLVIAIVPVMNYLWQVYMYIPSNRVVDLKQTSGKLPTMVSTIILFQPSYLLLLFISFYLLCIMVQILHNNGWYIGLMYDREWVLVDESRNYLNQKKVSDPFIIPLNITGRWYKPSKNRKLR